MRSINSFFKIYTKNLFFIILIISCFHSTNLFAKDSDDSTEKYKSSFAPAQDGSDVPKKYRKSVGMSDPDDAHNKLLSSDSYPSAIECGRCHPKIFTE